MIDINNTLDLVKLKFYNEWLYTAHIYDEGNSPMHDTLTKQVVTQYIDPLNLPKDAKIMDLGCGGGFPGIPLAIMFPETEFLLVDSIAKKIKVCGEVAIALELDNVRVKAERAENINRQMMTQAELLADSERLFREGILTREEFLAERKLIMQQTQTAISKFEKGGKL
jgi:16S rRNA G527 N7-methylase RsmG